MNSVSVKLIKYTRDNATNGVRVGVFSWWVEARSWLLTAGYLPTDDDELTWKHLAGPWYVRVLGRKKRGI